MRKLRRLIGLCILNARDCLLPEAKSSRSDGRKGEAQAFQENPCGVSLPACAAVQSEFSTCRAKFFVAGICEMANL